MVPVLGGQRNFGFRQYTIKTPLCIFLTWSTAWIQIVSLWWISLGILCRPSCVDALAKFFSCSLQAQFMLFIVLSENMKGIQLRHQHKKAYTNSSQNWSSWKICAQVTMYKLAHTLAFIKLKESNGCTSTASRNYPQESESTKETTFMTNGAHHAGKQ